MADVVFETTDFKVFLDIIEKYTKKSPKEVVYFLEFLSNSITIQCRAKNGNFIAERSMDLITHFKTDNVPDYTCNKPLRIAFDSETKDNLRRDSKKVTTVSFDGQRATFSKDDFKTEHSLLLPYVAPLSTEPPDSIAREKILESNNISGSRNFLFRHFYRIIKTLRTARIDLVRLRIPPSGKWLGVFGSDWFNSVACRIFPTKVKELDEQLDAYYNTIDLWHVINAMRRHYGRHTSTLTLSLIGTDEQLYFESSEKKNMVNKCAILNSIRPPQESLRKLFNWESTSPDHKFL